MIEVQGISKNFGKHQILRDLSISFSSHSRIALIGPSGSGKTVLLRSILGLESIEAGTIKADRSRLSVCIQNQSLLPWLTVWQNLRAVSGAPDEVLQRELDSVGLGSFHSHFPQQLSGGMQQKLNLIRAFLPQPKVLLMDEPFAHLDHAQKLELYDLTKIYLAKNACGMLLVTHDVDEALLLGREIWLAGRSPMQIVERIDSPVKDIASIRALHLHPEYPALFERVLAHLRGERS
ncbi:MAG: ABC transporter ATP-binding protein [Bacteriovoracia bacterium]